MSSGNIYVYMYVNIHVYICRNIHIHILTYVYMYICMSTYVYMKYIVKSVYTFQICNLPCINIPIYLSTMYVEDI